jgi:hypothetical protein
MIRHSRERSSGELELLIKSLDTNDSKSIQKNPLEDSLQTLRHDLISNNFIEQYEVSFN